ncbi:hypothetical protein [Micromonospora carbonacea]|uniref:Uncharacterized protein n=1 Tax=Micromonospora carbonacea TaxID=47853 RepID=A0A1C4WWE6_9ACTN|nr:hypothetical protein [Micromonospora carbonacea]SCF00566.1 hypothetical protein GA0070563_10480 [Micromonospora carbonacea]
MSALHPTPARLGLLGEVAQGRVFRDAAGADYVSGGRRVSAQLAEMERARWVALPDGQGLRTWQITHLGTAHRMIRILNYGTHAVAEIGPDDTPEVIGEARRRSETGRGSWWVQVGQGEAVCRTGSAALAELRRRAADLVAAQLAEAVTT